MGWVGGLRADRRRVSPEPWEIAVLDILERLDALKVSLVHAGRTDVALEVSSAQAVMHNARRLLQTR